MSIELTERDKELLNFLGEYKLANIDDIAKLYGTRNYHEKRMMVLKKAGYIKRSKNTVYLAKKGKEYLAGEGKMAYRVPSTKALKERALKTASLYLEFKGSGWEFLPSWRAKEEYHLDKGNIFYGIIRNSTEYMIYNIGKEPGKQKVHLLKRELEKLYSIGMRRAIIFGESKRAMEAYGVEGLGLDEQLLLPYTELGIELVKRYSEEDLNAKAAELALGEVGKAAWVGADYTLPDGKQVVVLVLNDIEKRARLKDYFKMAQYRHTRKQEVVIVCLESQAELFRLEYPECGIATVKESELLG